MMYHLTEQYFWHSQVEKDSDSVDWVNSVAFKLLLFLEFGLFLEFSQQETYR